MKKKLLLLAAALLFTACDAKPSTSNSTSQGGGETSTSTSTSTVDDGHIEGSKGLQYTLSDDETYYILTGLGSCKDDELIVGNWYNGKPVTEIGEAALSTGEGEWGPKTIRVSEGITTISFRGLRSRTVEYVYLPDSVTELAKATFILDKSLKAVVLPATLTKINDDAFMECPVQDIYFKGTSTQWDNIDKSLNNNTTLFKAAFHYGYKGGEAIDGKVEGSKGLEYTLSDDETYYSLTGIGTCKDDEVIVGNWYNGKPVTTIAGAALSTDEGTWGPKRIIVSNGITTIEFRGLRCMTAEYIYLPDTVTSLSKATFIRDSKLKTVVLSGSLTEILDDAFMECTSLQDIYFRGAESDWAKVQISTVNNDLSKVTMHYNYIG